MAMKVYPPEFKADAVALYLSDPARTYVSVAKDLGVNRETLRLWVRQARSAGSAAGDVGPAKTIDALASQSIDPTEVQAAEARSAIARCDQNLARYKAALDAGADPVEVAQWINTAKADRARAEGELRGVGTSKRMTRQEITTMMTGLGDLARVVVQADPADKADLYRELGLRLTYRPQKQLVEAKVIPGPDMCNWNVSEGRLDS